MSNTAPVAVTREAPDGKIASVMSEKTLGSESGRQRTSGLAPFAGAAGRANCDREFSTKFILIPGDSTGSNFTPLCGSLPCICVCHIGIGEAKEFGDNPGGILTLESNT